MKTLKQIQEENRKFIIMANNPSARLMMRLWRWNLKEAVK